MHFSENLKNLRGTFRKFDGSKTVSIVYPFKSIDFINYETNKILSVGPRNEGELFLIRSLGFKWKNIHSIDLISYLIILGSQVATCGAAISSARTKTSIAIKGRADRTT